MRIAFFNWRCIKNPSSGGAEVFNHHVLKRLAQKGHKVTLFTSSYPGCLEHETIDGVEHIRYGGRFLIYPKSYPCYKKHIESRYDVIVESINGVPFFTALFAKEKVVPFIHQLTRENWYSGMILPVAFAGYHTEDFLLRIYRNRPAIVPSESTKKDLQCLGFRDIEVIHGAADIDAPQMPKEKEPTMIYLGRITRSKRVEHVVRAFKRIKGSRTDTKLWIVGRGPEEKNIKRLARELGLEGSVRFFGWVDEKKKAELLSRAHLMLAPSAREGWGLVVLEANSCRTPVIGYDVHGLRDSIRPGINGYLAVDVESMASKALELLGDTEELERLSRSSKEYASKFSWDKTADGFAAALERALGLKESEGIVR